MVNEEGSFKKRYKMNTTGRGGETTTVAIPPEVIERAAEEAGLSPEEFIKQYHAVAHYDNGKGVQYTFESILPDKG